MTNITHIDSISQAYQLLSIGKPRHPMVAIVDNNCFSHNAMDKSISLGMYVISMKEGVSGSVRYGRSTYDFEDGQIMFIAPGQVIAPSEPTSGQESTGWTLLFHPDFIRRSPLASKINQYSFFSYAVNESLHISEQEKQTLAELIKQIARELNQNIDQHSQSLIVSTIELLLNYCNRFYDRQFYSRANMNKDTISDFESLLLTYYQANTQLEQGIPSVAYCGKELGISPNYLSDLLKKETGKTAKEHIQQFVVETAKNKLLGTNLSISNIAFDLGFDYPAHFTKLFKSATNFSPSEFRNSQDLKG